MNKNTFEFGLLSAVQTFPGKKTLFGKKTTENLKNAKILKFERLTPSVVFKYTKSEKMW